MSQPFTGTELEGREYILLLEVYYTGQTFRFATREVVVPTDDGAELPFVGTLPDTPFEDEYDLFSDSPRQASASFELDFSVFGVDIALLEAHDHDLSLATGELSLWVHGRTYEERIVVLSGKLTEPVSGEADQPVAFSIEQNTFEDGRIYPQARARITKQTWPDAPEDSLNVVYVTVFGQPGHGIDEDGNEINVAGSPAWLVDPPSSSTEMQSIRVLVAGHHVVEGTVLVHDEHLVDSDLVATLGESVYRTSRQVHNTYDALGQPCAVVYLDGVGSHHGDGSSGWVADLDGEYWIIWSGTAAGMPNETRTGAMVGAGEIMRHIYQQGSMAIDYGRFAVAEPVLNTFELAGYIDAEIKPHEWVTDNLSPILPMSLINGQSGVYPVVWPMDATEADAVAHLENGLNMWRDREERVSTEREELINECRIEYLLDGITDDFRLGYALSGDESANTDTAYHCVVSHQRYGAMAESLTTNMVTSGITARKIGLWRTRAFAFPRKTIRYTLDRKFAGLGIGDLVTISDPRLHWVRRLALLKSVAYQNIGPFATFILVADPTRDRKPIAATTTSNPNDLLRTANWTLEPAGGSVSISDGTAYTEIPMSAVRAYDAANGYNGPSAYTVRGEPGNISVYVRVTALTATSNGYNNLGVGLRTSSGSLRFSTLVTGNGDVYAHAHHLNSNLANVGAGTLSLTGDGWLRIRQTGGAVVFQYGTSVSGPPATWTTLHTFSEATSLDSVFFFMRQVISGHSAIVAGQLQTLILE